MFIELRRFTEAGAGLDAAVTVYADTWHRPLGPAWEFFHRYASYPGFRGRLAYMEGRLAGMGFGTEAFRGNWWVDRILAETGPCPEMEDAWSLVELAVLPAYRGRGVGTTLHGALLAGLPYRHAVLSTQVTNHRARRLYERLGWHYLHPGMPFQPHGELYVVMGKDLETSPRG